MSPAKTAAVELLGTLYDLASAKQRQQFLDGPEVRELLINYPPDEEDQ